MFAVPDLFQGLRSRVNQTERVVNRIDKLDCRRSSRVAQIPQSGALRRISPFDEGVVYAVDLDYHSSGVVAEGTKTAAGAFGEAEKDWQDEILFIGAARDAEGVADGLWDRIPLVKCRTSNV